MILPEPLLSTSMIYQKEFCVSIIENSGAEKAGLMANDIINQLTIFVFSAVDFPSLTLEKLQMFHS